MPTVREADGLALSSRNARLSPEGRAAAPVIHQALEAGAALVRAGEREAAAVRQAIFKVLGTEPRVAAEYVSVADPDTLGELDRLDGRALLSLAAFIDGVRLIDNERAGA